MTIKGRNRYIVVDIREEKEDDSTIVLLPDDYKKQDETHAIGIIRECGSCSGEYAPGEMIVFPRHLIQEFVFEGETTYLVLESHILCSIDGE